MSQQKDIKKLIKQLRQGGWHVEQGRTHYKAKHPNGGMVVMAVSPSCGHAYKNICADVRRLNKSHEMKVAA